MASNSTPMTVEQLNFSLIGRRLHKLYMDLKEASRWRPMEREPQMIIISKDIYPEVIHRAYEYGSRHFAEFDVEELIIKSNCGLVRQYCPCINWHFLGSLQVAKIKRLSAVHNLRVIHSIGSTEDADIMEGIVKKNLRLSPMLVTLKVNTSRERNRGGVLPENAEHLVDHLLRFCPHLYIKGLMTVGSSVNDQRGDFITLSHLREVLRRQFGLNLQVVMGWAKNFKHAIHYGADYFRMEVGVFGNE